MAYSRLVRDWCRHGAWEGTEGHHCDARIVLIGEAGGQEEDKTGLPFMGQSGERLNDWWRKVGLERADIYITNVLRRRPNAANDISSVDPDEIQRGIAELRDRLSQLADPFVIVPTGNVALNGLLGGTIGTGDSHLRILDWRGSILSWTDANGRQIKVIPSIHPAATFRQPILQKFCLADWSRIAKDSFFKELNLPERVHIIDPSEEQIEQFSGQAEYINDSWEMLTADERAKHPDMLIPPALAIDVENSMLDKKYFKEMTCVGFSYDPNLSLTISCLRSDYLDDGSHRMAWEAIKRLCALPIPKVLQNGLTDLYKLNHVGIPVVNYQWDLMEMDHALDPNDGGDTERGGEEASKDQYKIEMRSLKVLQSIYSRSPFHKLEGKTFDRVKALRYNGKDCCEEREIYGELWLKLKQAGRV